MPETTVDLANFFTAPAYDVETFETYTDLAYASAASRDRFLALTNEYRAQVEAGSGDKLRLAVALYAIGQYKDALERFARCPESKYRRYWAAQAAAFLGRIDQAVSELQEAAKQGWDAFLIDMQIAALKLREGDVDGAAALHRKHERAGQDRGEWYYVGGLLAEAHGDRNGALEKYEKAITLSPEHIGALFRAAWLHDMRGDDDKAADLYERVALQPRAHVNALINLAVAYEDMGKYDNAISCLRRVLAAYPNHTRARLFLKDVESSRGMVIEEGGPAQSETRNRLLESQLSDYELSVRARNCLKRMKINTVGDLLKLTEAELMAYKNFGETSLNEIKALLAKKGLRLGQRPEEIDPATIIETPPPRAPVPPGSEALIGRPVSELEFSVRARRCLQRLNIHTVGDLIQHNEADLLATRNFGVTSLNEIKARLTDLGLQLAPRP